MGCVTNLLNSRHTIAKGTFMTVSEFNNAVDTYSDGLYRFALKMTEDEEEARDIVQEVFIRVWEKRGSIDGNKVKSYLFTSVHHLCIDILRRHRNHKSLDDIEEEPIIEPRNYTGLNKLLDAILKQLPPVQRAVLMFRDYEGYTYEEIGQLTGLSESQVKVYIYRARLAVKKKIESLEHVI